MNKQRCTQRAKLDGATHFLAEDDGSLKFYRPSLMISGRYSSCKFTQTGDNSYYLLEKQWRFEEVPEMAVQL